MDSLLKVIVAICGVAGGSMLAIACVRTGLVFETIFGVTYGLLAAVVGVAVLVLPSP